MPASHGALSDELARAGVPAYDVPTTFTIVRFFNAYGPYQVAEFVLTRFIRSAMQGESPLINGDGTQTRSYCYVEDSCRGTIDATFSRACDGRVLNIGNSAEPMTLRALARLVLQLTGHEGMLEPRFDPGFSHGDRAREREIFQRLCDTSLAKSLIGFEARISVEEGIRRIIAQGLPPATWTAPRNVVTWQAPPSQHEDPVFESTLVLD